MYASRVYVKEDCSLAICIFANVHLYYECDDITELTSRLARHTYLTSRAFN